MNARHKIISIDDLVAWREDVRESNRTVVVTNGCFDIMHGGHVLYLEEARKLGDLLLVGINDDAGVRILKGIDRPINNEEDRALVVAALESVSTVCIFSGNRATKFLELARPDIYVKGGDYTLETLNKAERLVIQDVGAKIVFIPFEKDVSTTELLKKIKRL